MTEDTIIGIYQGLVNRHKLDHSGPPVCWIWISLQSVAVQTHIRGHQIQLEFSFGFAIYKLSPTIDPKALRVSRAAPAVSARQE